MYVLKLNSWFDALEKPISNYGRKSCVKLSGSCIMTPSFSLPREL